jgi:hypothetical protein
LEGGLIRIGNTLWNMSNVISMWVVGDAYVEVTLNILRVTSNGKGGGDTEPHIIIKQGKEAEALVRWIRSQEDASKPKQLSSGE